MSQKRNISPEPLEVIALVGLAALGVASFSNSVGVGFQTGLHFIASVLGITLTYVCLVVWWRALSIWWIAAWALALLVALVRMFRIDRFEAQCTSFLPCELPVHLSWYVLLALIAVTVGLTIIGFRRLPGAV